MAKASAKMARIREFSVIRRTSSKLIERFAQQAHLAWRYGMTATGA
jgi:hypothetical protein